MATLRPGPVVVSGGLATGYYLLVAGLAWGRDRAVDGRTLARTFLAVVVGVGFPVLCLLAAGLIAPLLLAGFVLIVVHGPWLRTDAPSVETVGTAGLYLGPGCVIAGGIEVVARTAL